MAIGALEIGRALIGWTALGELKTIDLNHEYFQGDVAIGLCPSNPQEFLELQTKKIAKRTSSHALCSRDHYSRTRRRQDNLCQFWSRRRPHSCRAVLEILLI